VRAAALALAKAVEKLLKTKSPSEEGPMSDLDTWWSGLASGLVSGINYGLITSAGVNIAKSLGVGIKQDATNWADLLFPSDLPTGLGQDILDSIAGIDKETVAPSTDAMAVVGESMVAATESVVTFRDTITALPGIASQAFQQLVEMISKALEKLPKTLAAPTDALLLVADAIASIGAAAYRTRAALRDTTAEILALWAQIAAQMAGTGNTPPGRQHGGPVKRGSPYVVGEAGPELFIPGTSGRIVPGATSGGQMIGGGGIVVNVYNAGSVLSERDLVSTVREGLLNIGLYNPGLLGGRA
jgi:hypothetical protein